MYNNIASSKSKDVIFKMILSFRHN